MATNSKVSCNISVEVWKQILWAYCCNKKIELNGDNDVTKIVMDALTQEKQKVQGIEKTLENAQKKLKFLEWISETGKAIGVLNVDETPKV